MSDRDLADLYEVKTKILNQAVKRNIARFPDDFMFQLSEKEFTNWRSQFVTSNNDKMGLRRAPFAFTEAGVSMLASILKSKTAVNTSVKIIRAFVEMRKFLLNNASIFQRLDSIEQKQLITDNRVNQILEAIESNEVKPKQKLFYNGQIFDAYTLVSDIIRTAKKSIVVIDNYIDDTTLKLFSKRENEVTVTLYTQKITEVIKQDLAKFNEQYKQIELKKLKTSHDRFMILDEKEVYHFGASLKDLGKK